MTFTYTFHIKLHITHYSLHVCQPATNLTQRVRSHLATVLITHYERVSPSLCKVYFLCERIHSYNIIRWTCVVQIERRARKSPSKHTSNFFHFFIRALFLFLSFESAVSLQPSFRLPFFNLLQAHFSTYMAWKA